MFKAILTRLDTAIDAEDRRILAGGVVLGGSVATVVIMFSAVLGLAWRVFQLAAGG